MKRAVVTLVGLVPVLAGAQVRASERATVSQTVDGTVITVDYSRPVARGRDSVFGRVVRWGEVWTPGANWATTLEINRDIRLNDHPLARGKYSLWMVPRAAGPWTVLVWDEARRFHTQRPDTTRARLRFAVMPQQLAPVEVLTFSFPEVRRDGARLIMQWGATAIPLEIEVPSSGRTPRDDGEPERDTAFAALVARLSEPGGYFDTDNLVSNERSYLHAVGALRDLGVTGGAYLGVGPDQNFSYILAVRPRLALLVDIRRDNMLQHLLFKELFLRARNRLEYLCLLFARPVPRDLAAWTERPLEDLLRYVDSTRAGALPALDPGRFGVPLDSVDRATIARMHQEFAATGLELRLTTFHRPPRLDYPTYRELLLETDLDGRPAGYLAREDGFRYVQSLHRERRIVPVVGDLSGERAMPAIARFLAERGLAVSAFYTSNVEQYLLRDGTFERFARNVAALPRARDAVIIRSYFLNRRSHPQQQPGYNTVQVLQTIASFLDGQARGGYDSYYDLVTRDVLELRRPAASPR
jgi:hypothetical protein